MGNGPIIPVEPVAPIPAIPAATLEPSRRVQSDEAPPGPIRRRSQPTADRTGTLVSAMVINLDAGRIALLSPEGPPVCGDVSTDLAVGSYALKPDRVKKQWAFEPRQVKSGLRFRVTLDGADPLRRWPTSTR